MSKIVDALHETKVFFHATVDQDNKAQVRPINSVIEYKGQIYFETSNKKNMYKQMLEKPNIAISGFNNGSWIRISGEVVMDDSDELKDVMFEMIPALKNTYSYEELVVYHLNHMKAIQYGFGKEPVELKD